MAMCEVCSKKVSFGHNIRHKSSGRWQRKAHRTQRTFQPNVHKQKITLGGETRRRYVCTQCIKTSMKVRG